MEIVEMVMRDDYPCDRCGKVGDLRGDFPDGPMLCLECYGIFTCRCCGQRYSECIGARDDYEGDPADYVCDWCQDRCHYDDEGADCEVVGAESGECRCPTQAGPIPKSCPTCGACNHTNLPPLHQLEESDIVTCGDCEEEVIVELLGSVSFPGTGLGP